MQHIVTGPSATPIAPTGITSLMKKCGLDQTEEVERDFGVFLAASAFIDKPPAETPVPDPIIPDQTELADGIDMDSAVVGGAIEENLASMLEALVNDEAESEGLAGEVLVDGEPIIEPAEPPCPAVLANADTEVAILQEVPTEPEPTNEMCEADGLPNKEVINDTTASTQETNGSKTVAAIAARPEGETMGATPEQHPDPVEKPYLETNPAIDAKTTPAAAAQLEESNTRADAPKQAEPFTTADPDSSSSSQTIQSASVMSNNKEDALADTTAEEAQDTLSTGSDAERSESRQSLDSETPRADTATDNNTQPASAPVIALGAEAANTASPLRDTRLRTDSVDLRTVSDRQSPVEQTAMAASSLERNATSSLHASNPPAAERVQMSNEDAFVSEILRQSQRLVKPDGTTEIRMRLDPPELGEVTVRLSYRDDQLRAEVQVDSHTTRTVIEDLMHRVKNTLVGDDVDLDSFQVSLRRQSDSHSEDPSARNGLPPHKRTGNGPDNEDQSSHVGIRFHRATLSDSASGAMDFVA